MNSVYIIAARRTAVVPRGGAFAQHEVYGLGSRVIEASLCDSGLSPHDVDNVVMGNALYGRGNPARLAALAAGLPETVPAMTIDILPTIAELIGTELPDHTIDGRNIWPLMAGKDGATSPHNAYFMYYGKQLQAVRSGKWKLHFPHGYRTMAGQPGGTGGIPTAYSQARIGLELFDLEADIGETTDVANSHPEIVDHLSKLADVMRKDLGDNNVRGAGIRPAGRL